jgi:hypothetical protein
MSEDVVEAGAEEELVAVDLLLPVEDGLPGDEDLG